MSGLIKAWRASIDAFVAGLEIYAAELRTGVSLIEAVAADEFETTLRLMTNGPDERAAVREGALELAKMGLSGEQFLDAGNAWARERMRAYRREAGLDRD